MYQFGFVGILAYLYLYSYFIPLYPVHSMALAWMSSYFSCLVSSLYDTSL